MVVSNMADQFKAGHTDWYSRTVSNDATGETLLVMGKDKEQVNHIADSIRFTGGNNKNNTDNTATVKTVNNTHIVGYDQDGNPVYEGKEPWVWVDSNGMKHWSPEHQQASREAQLEEDAYSRGYSDAQRDYYPEGGGSSQGSQSQDSGQGQGQDIGVNQMT